MSEETENKQEGVGDRQEGEGGEQTGTGTSNQASETGEREKIGDHVVFIGNKPFMKSE